MIADCEFRILDLHSEDILLRKQVILKARLKVSFARSFE